MPAPLLQVTGSAVGESFKRPLYRSYSRHATSTSMTDAVSQHTITLRGTSGQSSMGRVDIKALGIRARSWRAIVRGAGGVIVTTFLALIPALHFVLVPIGLVLTALMVLSAFRSRTQLLGGSGPCPYCNHTLTIFPRRATFPFHDVCEQCRRQVTVESSV